MKVKVRRAYFGAEGQTREGQILEMSEGRYRQLSEGIHLLHPLVDPVEVGFKMEPPPKNKMQSAPANKSAPPPPPQHDGKKGLTRGTSISFRRPGEEVAKKGTADPTPSPPDGGQTGEVNVVSLSEPDPPRVKRKYTRRAVRPELSSLIDPGN